MKLRLLACIATSVSMLTAAPAAAGPDPYIGDIVMVGQNFCPRGWLPAQGALLPISQNSALFSLLGTTYGGDGVTTFGLPDLRGRVPVGAGRGPGLDPVVRGQRFGLNRAQLLLPQLPAHTHTASSTAVSTINGSTSAPDSNTPTGNMFGTFGAAAKTYTSTGTPDQPLTNGTAQTTVTTQIGITGNSVAVERAQPSLGMLFCIATLGAYPPRN